MGTEAVPSQQACGMWSSKGFGEAPSGMSSATITHNILRVSSPFCVLTRPDWKNE